MIGKTFLIMAAAVLTVISLTVLLFALLGQGAAPQDPGSQIRANERPDEFAAGTYYARPDGGGESVVEIVNGTMPREIRVNGDFDIGADRIVYARDGSLFLVAPRGGEIEIVVEGAGEISSFVLSEDGVRALVKDAGNSYYSVDLATGNSEEADGPENGWLAATRKTVGRESA